MIFILGFSGTPLFERSKKHELYLTAAGESLVDYAKRLLSLQDEALAAVEQVEIAKACRPKTFVKPSNYPASVFLPCETPTFCLALEDYV